MIEESIKNLSKPVVDYLNNAAGTFIPGGTIYIVFVFSVLVGYIVMNRNNWGKVGLVLVASMIYFSFRWFGVGG